MVSLRLDIQIHFLIKSSELTRKLRFQYERNPYYESHYAKFDDSPKIIFNLAFLESD